MGTKPELGKWYVLSYTTPFKNPPWEETRSVSKCMQVGDGVVIHNTTYICALKNKEFGPNHSSESMTFVPNATFELDADDNCIFTKGV